MPPPAVLTFRQPRLYDAGVEGLTLAFRWEAYGGHHLVRRKLLPCQGGTRPCTPAAVREKMRRPQAGLHGG